MKIVTKIDFRCSPYSAKFYLGYITFGSNVPFGKINLSDKSFGKLNQENTFEKKVDVLRNLQLEKQNVTD